MTEMTNTLFRFATMRAPELLTEESMELYFVWHPNPVDEGHFKSLIETPIENIEDRRNAFFLLADTFTPLESVDEIVDLTGPLFVEFSNWLAKNATTVSKDPAFFGTQDQFASVTALETEDIFTIWDNLIYQVFKADEADAPLRDQLTQVLIANHFLSRESFYLTALSRVIMPPQLFLRDQFSNVHEVQQVSYNKRLQKDMEVALAKEKVTRFSKLVEELKYVQNKYNKENLQAYKTAKIAYDADVTVLLNENTETNPADGETWVTPVPVDPFDFTPEDELTWDKMESMLSPESYYISDTIGLQMPSTFTEVFESLNKEIQRQQEIILSADRINDKMIKFGNIVLPVTETLPLRQQYSYRLEPVAIGQGCKIVIALYLGYTASVANVSYQANDDTSTISASSFTDYLLDNTLIIELFPNGLDTGAFLTSIFLSGDIILSNGIRLRFENVGLPDIAYEGAMEQTTYESNINNYVSVTQGYGIKRLGIADYRQVEQTTCCYVPGEVSHIENVMAREYKEKSSRRLRRSEDTLSVERQTEKEDLTDTTSTDRYEMQQQTSEVISKDISASVSTNSNIKVPMLSMTIAANFAYNTSQQQSNSQAVTYAKDITQRAQERVLQKVREERTIKIVDEFEEQTKHGFDNRKGNEHVSGVYRWVDKIYKNRIFNYGKRLMYEFMIPQPSVFHTEIMKAVAASPSATVLEKPVDPRIRDLKDHRSLDEATSAAWAAVYNTEIEPVPDATIRISKAFQMDSVAGEIGSKADKIELPEGYKAVSADVNYMFYYHPSKIEFSHIVITVGDRKTPLVTNSTYFNNTYRLYFDSPINKEVAVGIEAADVSAISCTVVLNCVRTDQYYKQWQLNSFNAIVEAYEKKLAAYNDAMAAIESDPVSKETNPLFYRQIENLVLRKNCIHYLVPEYMIGRNFYANRGVTELRPDATQDMDGYASLVKFIEQAFEWDIMSYTFYPFYWGNKEDWRNLYQVQVNDPLFSSFLQSGMARVVVSVRPGFEEAVMHYIATGNLWNGGQVPVIGDDLYLSIVEELKNPTYYVEETWETRVPTTLTVIQKGSIGLDTEGLPCCEDDEDTGISQNEAVLTSEEEEVL
jgi:hypothetical protein